MTISGKIKSVLATAVLCGLALSVGPSEAHASGCVSFPEYQNVEAGDSPGTGTHRSVVLDHFEVAPTDGGGNEDLPGRFEKWDGWSRNVSCDGDHRYWIYYNRYVGPEGNVFFNVGRKCFNATDDGPDCVT